MTTPTATTPRAGAAARSPLVSVLIPMEDHRGEFLEHLGSWTRGQALSRDRFEVVVSGDRPPPGLEAEIAQEVGEGGRFARARAAGIMEAWNAAAGAARAPWLLITEAHCVAAPDCLARVEEVLRDDPPIDAFTLEHGHLGSNAEQRMAARWYDEVYTVWDRPGEWKRFNPVGFVIRREVFERIGGYDARCGMFATKLLGARLADTGVPTGHIGAATVLHVHHADVREHHGNSDEVAFGECVMREHYERAFATRFFGHGPIWTDRLRLHGEVARPLTATLAQATVRAAARRHPDVAWLAGETARAALGAAGARPVHRAADSLFRGREWLATHLPDGSDRAWRNYLSAQDAVVVAAQLRWVRDRATTPAPADPGSWDALELDETMLVGSHGAEPSTDGWLRWTRPAALLRVAGDAREPRRLVLDTDALRGPPRGYVRTVYVGGQRARPGMLGFDERRLTVAIVPGRVPEMARHGVVVLCRPADPAAATPPDPRRRGMPLRRVTVEAVS